MKPVHGPTEREPHVGMVCLIGRDIGHSASPQMQRAAFAALGLDHRYELSDIPPDGLAATFNALRGLEYLGANVTVPYKTAVLDLVDEIDPVAAQAGAVNTIVSRAGRLTASNTDLPALVDELKLLRPEPQRAVVLGSGGVARSVKVALQMLGSREIVFVSRQGDGGSVPWTMLPELLPDADLLVNATPVGTDSDESPVGADLLHPGLAVLDLVYRPSPTRLVREARAAGSRAHGGAGVLLGQGWRSLEAWLGAPVGDHVRAAMSRALRGELGHGADV